MQTFNQPAIAAAMLALLMLPCLGLSTHAEDLNQRLVDAARVGDASALRTLLAEGAGPNAKDKSGRTALMEAASGGYTESVRILLAHGATVNARDPVGWSALFRAALSGRTDTVRVLLQKGADVKAKDNDGKTALSWAASSGYTEIVRLLLSEGADANVRDSHGWTPLMGAANLGHLDTVKALLQKHASLLARDKDGNTAETLAEKYNYNAVVAALRNPAAPDTKAAEATARHSGTATPSASPPSANPAPDTKVETGFSAPPPQSVPAIPETAAAKSDPVNRKLLEAAEAGDTVEVLSLIREGAGVNARDPDYGTTALMRAAARGYTDTVRALLDKGGEVDAADSAGRTALIQAAFGGYTNTVLLLVERGANVNVHDHDGWTPLFWAAFSRRAETVRTLIEKGADVDARNKQQDTALIRAAYGGDMETLTILLEHHPDVDAADDMGRTALIEAAREDRADAVRLLMENGADVNHRDRNDDTATSLAEKQHSSRVMAALMDLAKKNRNEAPSAAASAAHPQPGSSGTQELVSEAQSLRRRSEARAFYRLGLSTSLLPSFGPNDHRQAEGAAAQILADLREVNGPAPLIELAQKTFTRLAYPANGDDGEPQPDVSEMRKKLDEYCLDQTAKGFFCAAGEFTFELNVLAGNVTKGDASVEDNRAKLLPRAVDFAARCEFIPECLDRVHSAFADSADILKRTTLAPQDGEALRKLTETISVALGNPER